MLSKKNYRDVRKALDIGKICETDLSGGDAAKCIPRSPRKSDGAHAQAVRFTDNVDKMKLNQADFKPEIRAASSRPTVQLRKSQNQLADNPIQSRQQVI